MKKKLLQIITSLLRKTTLVLSGVVLSFVLLEAGLRLGGFILSSIRTYENLQSVKQKGVYRILCLGESTTDRQYPQPLERILNQRNIGIRFSVIDKGRPAVNTLAILEKLESYLADYHPNMVIAMMGINDRSVRYYQDMPESDTWLFKHCRVYRFGRILCGHFLKQFQQKNMCGSDRAGLENRPKLDDKGTAIARADLSSEVSVDKVTKSDLHNDKGSTGAGNFFPRHDELFEASGFSVNLEEPNPKNDHAYVESGRLSLKRGNSSQAEDSFKRAIELNPKNDHAYLELGRLYLEQGKFSQAENLFKKALELNHKSDLAHFQLGRLFKLQTEFQKAESSFKKTIESNPESDNAYVELGHLYQMQGKFSQSEDSFRKALEINPENEGSYVAWGNLCRQQDKFFQAEDLFKKTIELNPMNKMACFGLGWIYRDQGKFLLAIDLFKKGAEFYPGNERALGATASLYEELGKPELARGYAEKARLLGLEDNAAVTVGNYRKLKEILDKKGIRLVCVQYPMRNVEPLKRIFGKDEGVIFVDNEGVFKEAVKRSSYKEYFSDMFAGDFGHCTQKGNKLLAQNISDVILGEVFDEK